MKITTTLKITNKPAATRNVVQDRFLDGGALGVSELGQACHEGVHLVELRWQKIWDSQSDPGSSTSSGNL
eukprot:1159610-Pelagomonas_calceolata.AAC.9